ncbi:MAG: AAA family ATPase [Blautia sp.]|nr:AAA family ATPase [Blautia sp.]
MIFVSGIHGVGKSYFCDKVKEQLGIISYSASDLITEKKKSGFSKDKLIPDIEDNQVYLKSAIEELKASSKNFILDGHFCLYDASGNITRISLSTFTDLSPDAIVLLTENPQIICDRRKSRDNIIEDPNKIERFQEEEILYAQEVAQLLQCKLFVSKGADHISNAISFLGGL